jgi:ketosteroid isomerase-like protein
MSQENVEIVRRVLGIAQQGIDDPAAAFERCVREGLVASNVEWRAGGRGGMAVAGLDDVAGRQGYLNFVRVWTEDFDDLSLEVEEIIDAGGDRVVAIASFSGAGQGSRASVEIRTALACRLEAGRVVRVTPFINPEHALRDLGLSE